MHQQNYDYDQTMSLLKAKLETVQESERDQARTIRELQAEQGTENSLKEKII